MIRGDDDAPGEGIEDARASGRAMTHDEDARVRSAPLGAAAGTLPDSRGTSTRGISADPWLTGATARHRADSVATGATEIRGAEPTAGISGTVGFV